MNKTQSYEWAVVGGGPAGIATIGQLLDHGVAASKILWIDPEFKVGDLGLCWQDVPSNTRVGLFQQFLQHCRSFHGVAEAQDWELYRQSSNDTCYLRLVAEPLQWLTHKLQKEVVAQQSWVRKIWQDDRCWYLQTDNGTFQSKSAVLATGAEPKSLAFPGPIEIPLPKALSKNALKELCKTDDTVAVFGSSHSAILAVRYLVELGVRKVINFYLEPLRYAVYFDDWIMFDNTGLKGSTADWARQNIDGTCPDCLQRAQSTEENINKFLPSCDKAIYAVGFTSRKSIEWVGYNNFAYNHHNGIIAPGLFGVGIGFPEGATDRMGTFEYRVGLWKFMEYLERTIPVWFRYSC